MMNSKMMLACVASLLGLAGAANADVWIENGDASGSGQIVLGSGPLTAITGVLTGNSTELADFEDLFVFSITEPLNFRATTVGGSGFDTQLFLFDAAGNGIAFNDDSAGTFNSTLTSTFTSSLAAGTYTIAVSGYDRDALDDGGLEIFADSPFNGERGPTAGRGPIASWGGSGSTGSYTISFNGAGFVPTPGAAALAGLGFLAAAKRRRRQDQRLLTNQA